MSDPFAPEADPARQDDDDFLLHRRTLLVALTVLPVLAGGCTHPRPACPTQPLDGEHCLHRYCRYHRRA